MSQYADENGFWTILMSSLMWKVVAAVISARTRWYNFTHQFHDSLITSKMAPILLVLSYLLLNPLLSLLHIPGTVSCHCARHTRLNIKCLAYLVKSCDTSSCSLKGRLCEVGAHVPDDVLQELVDMLIEQVTWNVVTSPTSHVDELIPRDLMSKVG